MSRGHGRVERAILEAIGTLEPHSGLPMSQLAAALYGAGTPTRSQLVSTRRAVRKLESEGLVKTRRDPAYPTPGRTYQRRSRNGSWCTAEGERWQLADHPGRCFHCEDGLPRHASGEGNYHLPLVTVSDVIETWVFAPQGQS